MSFWITRLVCKLWIIFASGLVLINHKVYNKKAMEGEYDNIGYDKDVM